MNKTLNGYQRPAVLKSIPLEFENPVLADSTVQVKSQIETIGQPLGLNGNGETIDLTGDNGFNYKWE